MFNRKIELRFVKDTNGKPVPADESGRALTPEEIIEITDKFGKRILAGIIITMTASFVLATAEHLIVNAVKNHYSA